MPLVTTLANRKRVWSGNTDRAGVAKKWKV